MRDDSSSAFEPFDAEPKRGEASPDLPEVLPPVEPPSARFIIQLFVIPALIVGGVIGIYFLFGRLATGEVDWRQQVDNVRSQNPHVRWRGALSLAEMLNTDSRLAANGQKLAENPDIVAALDGTVHGDAGRHAATNRRRHNWSFWRARWGGSTHRTRCFRC
ncbi:MAG: hypothetical protein U0992_12015 [Planctomycetaceae bacterium]